jgi:predicted enzyme related to lactoylglutathione lyase
MSDAEHPVGSTGWMDLTVPDAVATREFYEAVVGWTSSGLDMGGYEDFLMLRPGSTQPVAGICHARGQNAAIPAQWLMYVVVADLDASIAACEQHGGRALTAARSAGPGARFRVIQDPAGAVLALVSYEGASA